MLITKEVDVLLNSTNIKYYENLGYEIPRYKDKRGRISVKKGTIIKVKVEDLKKDSHVKVIVACDYDGTEKEVEYREYLKYHDEVLGDCCIKCRSIKYKNTMMKKYGVKSPFEIPAFKEKAMNTNREKYGYDWHMQSKEYQEHYKLVMKERYGFEHALQVPEFFDKFWNTMQRNGKSFASKPQIKLYELLKNHYENCDMEVPCGRCSLDCVVIIDNIKIDVEYDGYYWHTDEQRDRKRDNFVKSQGYKVLRVKGSKKEDIPSIEILQSSIEKLLNGFNYTEIKM